MTHPFNPALSALTCFACGASHRVGVLQTVCTRCGLPLRAGMAVGSYLTPEVVINPAVSSLWRYAAVLPVDPAAAVSLGEGWTPLSEVSPGVWVKDEAGNPTGSFKARGMAMAVSAARALGVRRLVAPSAGNAAVALAAYGAAAGLPVLVAMPDDTPRAFVEDCRALGAAVELVAGTIGDAGRRLARRRHEGDFDLATLREPYRIEGKKTMGYELWEQLGGRLPEVIVYPTGGGTGLIGMWKAFDEMEEMGWIGPARPRLVSAQAAGCAPIVAAFRAGADRTEPWPDPVTSAYGLRVPAPLGGFLCLRALRETRGTTVAVAEEEIGPAAAAFARSAGIDACPEGGAAWAALAHLRREGWVGAGERVVVFNTGAGRKYR